MKIDFTRKNLSIRILILFFGLGILAITLSYLKRTEPDQSFKNFRPNSKLAYAKGIHFTEYRGEKKVYSVSIETLSVERARVGPFAIGPLHVGQFSKVNVDLYLDAIESGKGKVNGGDDKDLEEDLQDFGIPISNIRNNLPPELRRVRTIKLRDLSISLWKHEERIFRISSDTAELDPKTRSLIFVGHATIDSGPNGRLLSHRIRWDSKTRFFSAGGPYLLTKNGEKGEGSGIEVDYQFKRIHDQASRE
jgi:hypothetical protein